MTKESNRRLTVTVVTTDLATKHESQTETVINFNNSAKRRWLMNHMLWAMDNGYEVVCRPESGE